MRSAIEDVILAVGLATIAAVIVFPSVVSDAGPEYQDQEEVMCFSGGHLFWHDVCEECHMTVNGVVQGVDTDGKKFAVKGDCILAPVGYDPGAKL